MALVRVEGLRELNRAFRVADKALASDMKDSLEEAAVPVRRDAQALAVFALRRMTPAWSKMRVGTAGGVVYVAPVERGARGQGNPRRRGENTRPPRFADQLMGKAMEPALKRNEDVVIRRVNDALNDMAHVWERA